VNIIESLQQELRRPVQANEVRFTPYSSTNVEDGGPTIADVTDELDETGFPATADGLQNTAEYSISPEPNQNEYGITDTVAGGSGTTMIQNSSSPLTSFIAPVSGTESVQQHQPLQTPEVYAPPQTWIDQGSKDEPSTTGVNWNTNAASPPFLVSPATAPMQEWSKPEFSQYLDYVQTDLDVLKDFLSSEGLDVDTIGLDADPFSGIEISSSNQHLNQPSIDQLKVG